MVSTSWTGAGGALWQMGHVVQMMGFIGAIPCGWWTGVELGVGRNGVVGAVGKNNSGSGGYCSRGFVWRSWELRGHVVAGDGGDNGGGS